MLARLKKLLLPLIVITAAFFIASAMTGSKKTIVTKKGEISLPVVNTVEVVIAEVPVSIVAYGNAKSKHELDLASEVTGRIVWVAPNFEPGERVQSGQVLLKVDSLEYRLALAEAEAALATANIALADAIALKRTAAQAETKLLIEAVQLRISKAEQKLAYTEIRAPFNAVIDRQVVELGQFINTGQSVARLLSSDAVEITLPVPASDAGFLDPEPGTPVSLFAKMGADRHQWEGRVLRVESRIDMETRVIPVVVEVISPYDTNIHDHALKLGLFVEAHIPGKPFAAAVRLPSSALQSVGSVFLLQDGALQRRAVEVAYRQGNFLVVSGGLDAGEQVVVSELDVMFQGMKVSGAL